VSLGANCFLCAARIDSLLKFKSELAHWMQLWLRLMCSSQATTARAQRKAPASKLVGDSARIPAAAVVKRCEVFAKIRRRGDERSQKSGLQCVNPHSE
jgi:hypothetical protein